jgi:hypothetical protein
MMIAVEGLWAHTHTHARTPTQTHTTHVFCTRDLDQPSDERINVGEVSLCPEIDVTAMAFEDVVQTEEEASGQLFVGSSHCLVTSSLSEGHDEGG